MDPVDRDHALLSSITRQHLQRPIHHVEPVLAGLDERRFHRIFFEEGEPHTLIARIEPEPEGPSSGGAGGTRREVDAAPAWLPEPALEPLRSFLEAAGLPVPSSALHLPEHRLDLLEDVGARSLRSVPRQEREARYREACDLVSRLQSLSAEASQIPAFVQTRARS